MSYTLRHLNCVHGDYAKIVIDNSVFCDADVHKMLVRNNSSTSDSRAQSTLSPCCVKLTQHYPQVIELIKHELEVPTSHLLQFE